MSAPRQRQRINQGAAVAAVLAGMPSTLDTVRRKRTPGAIAGYIYEATAAIGTLVPPGRPGFVKGTVLHGLISLGVAEGLARTLPRAHSVRAGTAAGFAVGVVNVGLIGRRFPAIRALPLLPQLADNAAFGAIFAAVADR